MLSPSLFPGIEQSNHLTGARIDSREIRPFKFVTPVTRERQIRRSVIPTMLPRDYVLDLVPQKRDIVLQNATVFTPLACAFPHGLAHRVRHLERPANLIVRRALACNIAITSNAST
jgi:hypothetical protein